MADVGRMAGVSPTTVSFVINERAGETIRPATRQRVLDAVDRLGYRPNRTAQGLRTRRTHTIGFVNHETAENSFAGPAMSGTHDVAWSRGSRMLVVNTNRYRSVLQSSIRDLLDRQVDAIIVVAAGTRSVRLPEPVPVPTILVNCLSPGGTQPSVLPDELAGGAAQARLALDAGHRRITLLPGTASAWATRARVRGWHAAFAAAGVDWSGLELRYGTFGVESGYDLTRAVMAHGPPPTALLCGNDRMALGALLALSELGLKVPADVSVVGYDDQVGLAANVHPSLTTVRLPYYAMGRWAAEQLLSHRVDRLPRRTFMPCLPVVRDSLAAPCRFRSEPDEHGQVTVACPP